MRSPRPTGAVQIALFLPYECSPDSICLSCGCSPDSICLSCGCSPDNTCLPYGCSPDSICLSYGCSPDNTCLPYGCSPDNTCLSCKCCSYNLPSIRASVRKAHAARARGARARGARARGARNFLPHSSEKRRNRQDRPAAAGRIKFPKKVQLCRTFLPLPRDTYPRAPSLALRAIHLVSRAAPAVQGRGGYPLRFRRNRRGIQGGTESPLEERQRAITGISVVSSSSRLFR